MWVRVARFEGGTADGPRGRDGPVEGGPGRVQKRRSSSWSRGRDSSTWRRSTAPRGPVSRSSFATRRRTCAKPTRRSTTCLAPAEASGRRVSARGVRGHARRGHDVTGVSRAGRASHPRPCTGRSRSSARPGSACDPARSPARSRARAWRGSSRRARSRAHSSPGCRRRTSVRKSSIAGRERLEAARRPPRRDHCRPARADDPRGSAPRSPASSDPPRSRTSLAQARIEAHLEAERLRQDLCGLARPAQVARVDGVDGAVEGAGERRACSRPRSLRRVSAWPCQRPSRFQSVSPCRASRIVVTATRLGRPWISASGPRLPRHRLDRGIGLETARLLRRGARGRRQRSRSPNASRAHGPEAAPRSASPAISSEPGAPEAARRRGRAEALGRVDCLVNNVGVAVQVDFEELTDERVGAMWQLNVMSYVRAIRAVLPGDARARSAARSSTSPRPRASGPRRACRTTP